MISQAPPVVASKGGTNARKKSGSASSSLKHGTTTDNNGVVAWPSAGVVDRVIIQKCVNSFAVVSIQFGVRRVGDTCAQDIFCIN
jgi:hypothetical protein